MSFIEGYAAAIQAIQYLGESNAKLGNALVQAYSSGGLKNEKMSEEFLEGERVRY